MKTVLFLCTGNYYRSRFAEILFNDLTQKNNLDWCAISRGLASEISLLRNPGPISQFALSGLSALSIFPDEPIRFPKKVTYDELQDADLIIALSEKEHKALFTQNYPEFRGQVRFWEIGDVDIENAENALRRLEFEIKQLVIKLTHER